MPKERIDQKTYDAAKRLMGIPDGQPSLEAGTAISCAFDMGYRTSDGIARMARKLMAGPPATNSADR
jgi:hypothetical protein